MNTNNRTLTFSNNHAKIVLHQLSFLYLLFGYAHDKYQFMIPFEFLSLLDKLYIIGKFT